MMKLMDEKQLGQQAMTEVTVMQPTRQQEMTEKMAMQQTRQQGITEETVRQGNNILNNIPSNLSSFTWIIISCRSSVVIHKVGSPIICVPHLPTLRKCFLSSIATKSYTDH